MFCVFLTQSWRKKENHFPPIFAQKNDFLKKLKRSGKNSRNFQEKTQENIQKLKQNEHQVLSCTQKKCKINTPDIQPNYELSIVISWKKAIKIPLIRSHAVIHKSLKNAVLVKISTSKAVCYLLSLKCRTKVLDHSLLEFWTKIFNFFQCFSLTHPKSSSDSKFWQ